MAKRKRARGGPNKSQAIRDYFAKNRNAKPKEVIEALAKLGIEVSHALVGNVKYGSGKKAVKVKKTSRAGRPQRAVLSADDLLQAKRMADQLGGISKAKQALETLEKLV